MNCVFKKMRVFQAIPYAIVLNCLIAGAQAQTTEPPRIVSTLAEVFNVAWLRQPEARASSLRREASVAQINAANMLTSESPSFEISQRSDRMNGNQGSREIEIGFAVPLWLPGQRSASQQLAEVESSFVDHKIHATKLRLAATVREAWWNWHRATLDRQVALDHLSNAQKIFSDVTKRKAAGDLAKSDQYQAEGAVAAAEVLVAQAQAEVTAAAAALAALSGISVQVKSTVNLVSETLPSSTQSKIHPTVAELEGRLEVLKKTADLVSTQKRAAPELTIATSRERGAFGERYGQTVMFGVRIPLGDGARFDARFSSARAEVVEAESQLNIEREKLKSEQSVAEFRVQAARTQLRAIERRSYLAKESRQFFDKSFRLGETDLPTRLRVESEALEAERQLANSQINLAAAISSWRQSLGLLPE